MRKSVFSKVVLFTLVICMVGSVLTGCVQKAKETPVTLPPSSSATDDVTSKKPESKSKDPLGEIPASLKDSTVKFLLGYDPSKNPEQLIMNDFADKSGIKIEVISVAGKEYDTKLAGMIASGSSPDVFEMKSFPTVSYELAQPLETGKVDVNDPIWDKETLKYTTINGKAYGANISGSIFSNVDVFFYNNELFKENGIKTPKEYLDEGNWTWDTLRKAASEIDALGEEYIGFTDGSQAASMLSAGIDFIIFDGKKFINNIGDPRLTEFFKIQAALKKDGLMVEWKLKEFVAGTVGMMCYTQFGLKGAGQLKPMNDFKFVPFPSLKAGEKAYVPYKLRSFGIVKGSSNPEGAGHFLRYYLDPINWNLETMFVNQECRDYYYDINSTEHRFPMRSQGVLAMTDGGVFTEIYGKLCSTDPAQITTVLQENKNIIDSAVKKANETFFGK